MAQVQFDAALLQVNPPDIHGRTNFILGFGAERLAISEM